MLDIAALFETPEMQRRLSSGPSETLATYFEVYNTFAKIVLASRSNTSKKGSESAVQIAASHLFADNPWEEYLLLIVKHSDSMDGLLGNAIIRRAVYTSAITVDVESLQKALKHTAELNTDIALAAVECVSDSWANCSSAMSLDVAKAYLGLITVTDSIEVCSAALSQLADTFESRFKYAKPAGKTTRPSDIHDDDSRVFSFDISGLQKPVLGRKEAPSLSNAWIRISGTIPFFKELSFHLFPSSAKPQRQYLEAWGRSLSAAGVADNVCNLFDPSVRDANDRRTSILATEQQQPWQHFMEIPK